MFVLVFALVFLFVSPVAAKELPVRISGKPNPQVLAVEAWRALKNIGFVQGDQPPRYQMNAFYDADGFRLDVLLPNGNQCLMAHHYFVRRNGRWYVTEDDRFLDGQGNVNRRHRDYLSKLLDFYNAPTAFPLIVEPERARTAYKLLLAAASTEQWRLQPDPSLKFRNPDVPIRPEPRTSDAFQAIVSTFAQEARYVGLTSVSETDEVLWVQAEDRYSLFLLRMIGGDQVVTDWYTNIRLTDDPRPGRVCTIPIEPVAQQNRLTLGQLIEQQPQAQALLRMFRLAAMQNLNEVMAYCAVSVSSKDRQRWWPGFYEAAKSMRDIVELTVEPKQNGRYVVRYPTKDGERTLQCVVAGDRFQVVGFHPMQSIAVTPKQETTTSRMLTLVRRALKQVDQPGGIDYIYYDRTYPDAQQREFKDLRAWAVYRWKFDRVIYLKSTRVPVLLVVERMADQYRIIWVGFTRDLQYISYVQIVDNHDGDRYGDMLRPLSRSDVEGIIQGLGGVKIDLKEKI